MILGLPFPTYLGWFVGAPLGFRQALGQNLRLGAAANLALWCAALVLVLGPAVRRALRAVRERRAADG